jgi:hypothetical protein
MLLQVPNFGFIVFDSVEAVDAALAKRPIYLDEHGKQR